MKFFVPSEIAEHLAEEGFRAVVQEHIFQLAESVIAGGANRIAQARIALELSKPP